MTAQTAIAAGALRGGQGLFTFCRVWLIGVGVVVSGPDWTDKVSEICLNWSWLMNRPAELIPPNLFTCPGLADC